MLKSSSLIAVFLVLGLSGCFTTQTKTGLARPDFSKPALVTSNTAPVKTGCHCGGCVYPSPNGGAPKRDLTTPPEPQKGKKIVGELPEYQDEDIGEGPI